MEHSRLLELLGEMSLEEKINQLFQGFCIEFRFFDLDNIIRSGYILHHGVLKHQQDIHFPAQAGGDVGKAIGVVAENIGIFAVCKGPVQQRHHRIFIMRLRFPDGYIPSGSAHGTDTALKSCFCASKTD